MSSQYDSVGPAFVCTVCNTPVRSRFIPDIAPKCPSCGAATRPTERLRNTDVRAFCARCHYEGPAFVSTTCPECGAYFSGFPGVRPESSKIAPDNLPKPAKQGPSGGIKPRQRKST